VRWEYPVETEVGELTVELLSRAEKSCEGSAVTSGSAQCCWELEVWAFHRWQQRLLFLDSGPNQAEIVVNLVGTPASPSDVMICITFWDIGVSELAHGSFRHEGACHRYLVWERVAIGRV